MVIDMNKWIVRDTGQIYKDEVEMNYFREREMVLRLSE